MGQFLSAIPELVLYGCATLIVSALLVGIWLALQARRTGSQVRALADALQSATPSNKSESRNGLPLSKLDEIRSRCEILDHAPREWWAVLDNHIDEYTSPQDVQGWFLSEKSRQLLPYEVVIGRHFHSAFFSSFAGLLTGAGLTLTFVAILIALY